MSASLTAEQLGSVLALCDSRAASSMMQAAYCATVAVHVGGGAKQEVPEPGPMTSDALQLVSIDVQLVRSTASDGELGALRGGQHAERFAGADGGERAAAAVSRVAGAAGVAAARRAGATRATG